MKKGKCVANYGRERGGSVAVISGRNGDESQTDPQDRARTKFRDEILCLAAINE